MKPIKRSIAGAGNLVIPLSTYGEIGVSIHLGTPANATVHALADKDDTGSIINAAAGLTKTDSGGVTIDFPADAIYIVATGATTVTVLQYGE